MRFSFLFSLAVLALSTIHAAADEPAPPVAKEPPKPSKESYLKVRVEVEIRGTLQFGEKGATILAKDRTFDWFHPNAELEDVAYAGTYELDFTKAKDLRELAKVLSGKEVVVVGKAELKRFMQKVRSGPGGYSGPNPMPFWHPTPVWIVQPSLQVISLESVAK